MFRSQIILDLSNPSVQQALRNCNDMHRNIMKAFPESEVSEPRKDNSLLYNLMEYNGKTVLYVTSKLMPDWSKVSGYSLYEGIEPRDISPLQKTFTENSCFSFQLFASPTKKVSRQGKLSSRVFLQTKDDRAEWLRKKADQYGFELLSFSEIKEKTIQGKKKDNDIYYHGVVFEGILKITNPVAFWDAYTGGIGAGKSYGLGMLMLKK